MVFWGGVNFFFVGMLTGGNRDRKESMLRDFLFMEKGGVGSI